MLIFDQNHTISLIYLGRTYICIIFNGLTNPKLWNYFLTEDNFYFIMQKQPNLILIVLMLINFVLKYIRQELKIINKYIYFQVKNYNF